MPPTPPSPEEEKAHLTARYLELVEELRAELGSYKAVAEELGISQSYLSRLRAGKLSVGWTLAQRAAEGVGISPYWFHAPHGVSFKGFDAPVRTDWKAEQPPDRSEESMAWDFVIHVLTGGQLTHDVSRVVGEREAMILRAVAADHWRDEERACVLITAALVPPGGCREPLSSSE